MLAQFKHDTRNITKMMDKNWARTLQAKAQSDTSANVSDVKVTDEDGDLYRTKIKTTNKTVKKLLRYTSENANDEVRT